MIRTAQTLFVIAFILFMWAAIEHMANRTLVKGISSRDSLIRELTVHDSIVSEQYDKCIGENKKTLDDLRSKVDSFLIEGFLRKK